MTPMAWLAATSTESTLLGKILVFLIVVVPSCSSLWSPR
jgi:hypothetical protein